jgi:transcription-repair coupling factor (superfamily II helicase)
MQLSALLSQFQKHPQVKILAQFINKQQPNITCEGLLASSSPVCIASAAVLAGHKCVYLIVLNDEEEAGYFYHDLLQLLSEENVKFYPSSFRRAVKYGQRDAANEILRTEVLSILTNAKFNSPCFIVTHPSAIAERIESSESLQSKTIILNEGEEHDVTELSNRLKELGFKRRDYVYEPGEFALRGSILDIYSFADEHPYRLDFFGDEICSIRTFEIQTQLSKELKKSVCIVSW